MSQSHTRLDDATVRGILQSSRTIAVVGYSDKADRAGHFVPEYLSQQGYGIIAVNPKFDGSVDGFRVYPSLRDIPEGTQVDVVVVFRSPDAAPGILEDAARMAPVPRVFWMQPGAENPACLDRAAELGMIAVNGLCMLAEHQRLFAE